MHATKTTYLFVLALLTTHHTHIKSSVLVNTAAAAIVTVAVLYGYVQYKETYKSNEDKFVDGVARETKSIVHTGKDLVQKIKDTFKK